MDEEYLRKKYFLERQMALLDILYDSVDDVADNYSREENSLFSKLKKVWYDMLSLVNELEKIDTEYKILHAKFEREAIKGE